MGKRNERHFIVPATGTGRQAWEGAWTWVHEWLHGHKEVTQDTQSHGRHLIKGSEGMKGVMEGHTAPDRVALLRVNKRVSDRV